MHLLALTLLIAFPLIAAPPATSSPAISTGLEVRLAFLEPGPNLIRVDISNQFGPVYMAPTPFLTTKHMKRVVSEPDDHGFPGIKLYFTREGAAIIRRISTANLGKHIVFLLAGRPVFAPRIEEPISSDFTRIDGFLTQAQIDAFVSAVPAK